MIRGPVLQKNKFRFLFWFCKSDLVPVQFYVTQTGTRVLTQLSFNIGLALGSSIFKNAIISLVLPKKKKKKELVPVLEPIPKIRPHFLIWFLFIITSGSNLLN
jgi:hypothetical protein